MTVLFVSSIGDLRGGAERSLLELAGALEARGIGVALAAWQDGALVEAFGRLGPTHVLGARDPASPLGGATRSRALARLRPLVRLASWLRLWVRPTASEAEWLKTVAEATGADLLHTNCDMSPLAARAAARALDRPWVAHVRDHWRSWFHPRTARALRGADAVIAPSRFLAERFADRGIPCRIVPNPVAGAPYREAGVDGRGSSSPSTESLRRSVGLGDRAFGVAVVGRVDAQKRTMDVVRAARRMDDSSPVEFVVAGGGPEAERWRLARAVEEAGVQTRVHLLGYREDVPAWLPAMDALAVPSRGEPFGRMVVEAMHAGLPVVAYRDGAAPELIDHGRTGLLVSPGDPEALASAVRSLASDPDRARAMGAAGREAARRYEPAEVARLMEDLYGELRGS